MKRIIQRHSIGIKNKLKRLRRKTFYITLFSLLFTLSACVDTIILPDDKTVEEDFWQTKKQVQSMVNGAYTAPLFLSGCVRSVYWSGPDTP